MIATLRENGINDLIIFEFLEFFTNKKYKDILSYLNDNFFKYIFFFGIVLYNLRQDRIKSKINSIIFLLYLNFCLFLDRTKISHFNNEILKVLDFFLFVSIFFLIKRKFKK